MAQMISPKKRRQPDSSIDEHNQPIPFYECCAKTYQLPSGEIKTGRTVLEHCRIVAQVAIELVNRFPVELSQKLFPSGFEIVAGSHDVGKVSPTFQKKIFQNTDEYQPESYPSLKNINPKLESNWGGHAGVSQLTLEAMDAGKYIPEIAGQHHGFNPQVCGHMAQGEVFGGTRWQQERVKLINELKKKLNANWPNIESPEQARLVAGLTSVADWIGSGEYFEDPDKNWQDNINLALDKAGFIPPLIKKDMDFSNIFFGFKPYPAQEKLIALADRPGVYVLEAPMGHGKTEAALYAAYQLLERQEATGIYFALPTQLTSNKIYTRFNAFLDKILAPACYHRQALLLHGSAWLLEHTDIGKEGRPGGAWFNTNKRGLLAPFAVGTIDQALMAVMNVRHGFVRAFGLAGKVVILDEVHTYDIYTGTILDALVKMLRNLECTVIILSATLNHDRRQELLGTILKKNSYPLITAQANGRPLTEFHVPASSSQKFSLYNVDNETKAKEAALRRAEQGQQVLWIENSVAEAQNCFLDLAARAFELGVDCGLLHSRFTAEHRQQKEEHWVSIFGKPGWTERKRQGRILIGTQVLEQSLDIDADFLVTRFCPTDMLLQRLGRLWRHGETPRSPSARKEAWLITPNPRSVEKCPGVAFGVSGLIYSPYVLCRSLEVWQNRYEITLPADIRPLIEATYSSRKEIGELANLKRELKEGSRYRKGMNALEQLARATLAQEGKTLPETKAQTRYSEADTVEVLVVKEVSFNSDQRQTRMILLDGTPLFLSWDRHKASRQAWRQIAAKLMQQVVSVMPGHAPAPITMNTLRKIGLGNCLYLGNRGDEDALLRLVLVDETGAMKGYQGTPLYEKGTLQYRDDLGYRIIKNKE